MARDEAFFTIFLLMTTRDFLFQFVLGIKIFWFSLTFDRNNPDRKVRLNVLLKSRDEVDIKFKLLYGKFEVSGSITCTLK